MNTNLESKPNPHFVDVKELIPDIKDFDKVDFHENAFAGMPTEFTGTIWKDLMNSEAARELLQPFKDQIVVDLGAGAYSEGYEIAELVGAKGYIGVDPHNAEQLRSHVQYREEATIPGAVVETDALAFLKALPDHSVSIFCSGLDENIIKDKQYIREVAAEIQRVLHKQGAYFDNDSVFWHALPEAKKVVLTFHPSIVKNIDDLFSHEVGKLRLFTVSNYVDEIRNISQKKVDELNLGERL